MQDFISELWRRELDILVKAFWFTVAGFAGYGLYRLSKWLEEQYH